MLLGLLVCRSTVMSRRRADNLAQVLALHGIEAEILHTSASIRQPSEMP